MMRAQREASKPGKISTETEVRTYLDQPPFPHHIPMP